MTIRLRLTLWYTGILALTLLLFGTALYGFLSYTYQNNQKDGLKEVMRNVDPQVGVQAIVINGRWVTYQTSLPQLDEYRYSGYVVQIVDKEGKVQRASNTPILMDVGIIEEMQKEANQNGRFHNVDYNGNSLLVLSKPIYLPIQSDQTMFYGILQVIVAQNGVHSFLDTLLSVLIILTVIVIAVGASLGLFLARQALKPIDQVIAATERIERGDDLANRIEYIGPPDEIGRLTNKINSMLERLQGAYSELEEAYSAQRRFVSDASHELRTPLTTIRGNVDLLERVWARGGNDGGQQALTDPQQLELSREAMQDIAGEAARMSRLVNDLLSLARADAGVVMAKEIVPIAPIVEQVVRRAGMLPKRAEWQVGDLSELEGVSVYGNTDYLQQLLFIFIENAFKYTDEGYVRIETLRDRNQIGIRISDTGIGMDKEEVPHIFERFYRADPSRGKKAGTGLGLSIAKWIIDEHEGSIEVTTRKNEGSAFVIWLPVRFLPISE